MRRPTTITSESKLEEFIKLLIQTQQRHTQERQALEQLNKPHLGLVQASVPSIVLQQNLSASSKAFCWLNPIINIRCKKEAY